MDQQRDISTGAQRSGKWPGFIKTDMKTINITGASTRAALSTGGRAKRNFLSIAAKTLPLASGLAMAASIASAQSFTGLGFFTDPPVAGTESYARSVSNDGVVVGYGFIPPANAPTTGFRAFGWTQAGGMENLGTLLGGTYSASRAVSANGLTVAGGSGTPVGSVELTHACVWTGAGVLDLGPSGAGNSLAYGISDNGSVVVGSSYLANSQLQASRWTGGVMASLGVLSGTGWASSTAFGVSGDGQVVVGVCEKSQANNGRAFRWTPSGGMQTLGTLKSGKFSEAWAANANGSVVVGSSDSVGGSRAFRWTSAGMKDLGVLSGQPYSYGRAISGDGSKIVGYCGNGTVEVLPISGSNVTTGRAFYWTSVTGMVDLNTYLAPLIPPGWTLREARGISADGTTITGWGIHNGSAEAWVARLVP